MRLARLAAAGLALAAAACSSSKESPAGPPPVAEPVTDVQGLTSFLQAVPLDEPYYPGQDFELFPGCANVWDLGSDLSLLDGGNDQWDGALELRIGTLATSPATFDSVALEVDALAPVETLAPFAPAGGYEALRYATPSLSAAEVPVAVASDGALLDEPALSGTGAFLAPTLDSRLQQAIDLRAAAAPVALGLVDRVWLHAYGLGSQPASYRIVVRSPADGSVLGTVLDQVGSSTRTTRSLDLSAFAGEQIVLSFELHSEPEDGGNALAAIDDVSITDAAGHELVRNGDFEQQGLAGWTLAGDPGFRQLVTAAVPVADLQVTRSFYTAPRLPWARWVDELENLGSTPVTRDVVYLSDLGSDGAGIVYATPGTTGAVSSWDGSDFRDGADRDVALVHGDGTALFRSSAELTSSCLPVAPATSCGWDGDDRIFVVHRITVPAGGKVSLVHFIVMNGENTGRSATSVDSRAVAIDAVASAIANGFGKGGGYADYMTASQVATVANF